MDKVATVTFGLLLTHPDTSQTLVFLNPLQTLQTYSNRFSAYSTSESKEKCHFYTSAVVLHVSTLMNACMQSNMVKCFVNVTARCILLRSQNKDVTIGAGSRSMLSWVDCSLCFAVLHKWLLWL